MCTRSLLPLVWEQVCTEVSIGSPADELEFYLNSSTACAELRNGLEIWLSILEPTSNGIELHVKFTKHDLS